MKAPSINVQLFQQFILNTIKKQLKIKLENSVITSMFHLKKSLTDGI